MSIPTRAVTATVEEPLELKVNGRGRPVPQEAPTPGELLAAEPDILQAMFAAKKHKQAVTTDGVTLNIRRDGEIVLRIRVRPLDPDEISALVEAHTTWAPNPATGGRRAEKFDQAAYARAYIVRATLKTIPVPGKAGEFESMWFAFARVHNVLPVENVVTQVLLGGEVGDVFEALENLGRYNQRDAVETAKNE